MTTTVPIHQSQKQTDHRSGAPRILPDDATLAALVTSGAFYAEIARRYAVTAQAVRKHARRLGFDPIPPGRRQPRRDSAVDSATASALQVR